MGHESEYAKHLNNLVSISLINKITCEFMINIDKCYYIKRIKARLLKVTFIAAELLVYCSPTCLVIHQRHGYS